MIILVEATKSATRNLIRAKLRSSLTVLGVAIAVASVICVIIVIRGLGESLLSQFSQVGKNTITVRSYTPLEDQLKLNFSTLTLEDYRVIVDRVGSLSSVTPLLFGLNVSQIRSKASAHFTRVIGTTETYRNTQDIYLKYGRFLSHEDNISRRKICIIGEKVRQELSLPENPTGSYVEINNEWFKIVGLASPKGTMFGFSLDDYVLLPFETMQSLNGASSVVDIQLQISLEPSANTDQIINDIENVLRKSRKLERKPDNFIVETAKEFEQMIKRVTNIVTMVFSGMVGISLIVGGVGIMNIMLISVSERTKEIGVLKALGAKNSYILLLFLIESLLLCLIGGVIGVLVGLMFGGFIAAVVPGLSIANISLDVIWGAVGFSVLIGIIFGIIPATKAANLDPIEALRFE